MCLSSSGYRKRHALPVSLYYLISSTRSVQTIGTRELDKISFLWTSHLGQRNLTNIMKRRIIEWHGKTTSVQPDTQRFRKHQNRARHLASVVLSKIEEGSFKVAIRIICSEDTPAPDSLDILKALQEKHSKAPSDRRTPCDPSSSAHFAALQVSSFEVSAAIKSFSLGSSNGLESVSPQHIRDLLSDPGLLQTAH